MRKQSPIKQCRELKKTLITFLIHILKPFQDLLRPLLSINVMANHGKKETIIEILNMIPKKMSLSEGMIHQVITRTIQVLLVSISNHKVCMLLKFLSLAFKTSIKKPHAIFFFPDSGFAQTAQPISPLATHQSPLATKDTLPKITSKSSQRATLKSTVTGRLSHPLTKYITLRVRSFRNYSMLQKIYRVMTFGKKTKRTFIMKTGRLTFISIRMPVRTLRRTPVFTNARLLVRRNLSRRDSGFRR